MHCSSLLSFLFLTALKHNHCVLRDSAFDVCSTNCGPTTSPRVEYCSEWMILYRRYKQKHTKCHSTVRQFLTLFPRENCWAWNSWLYHTGRSPFMQRTFQIASKQITYSLGITTIKFSSSSPDPDCVSHSYYWVINRLSKSSQAMSNNSSSKGVNQSLINSQMLLQQGRVTVPSWRTTANCLNMFCSGFLFYFIAVCTYCCIRAWSVNCVQHLWRAACLTHITTDHNSQFKW